MAPLSPGLGGAPSISMPVLACRASEVVDSASLAYLLAQSLAAKEQEEKKKMAEDKEKVLRAKRQEKEKKLEAAKEEEEDPDGWLQAFDSDGDLYHWHRRTRRAKWSPPSASGKRKKKKEEEDVQEDSAAPAHDVSSILSLL